MRRFSGAAFLIALIAIAPPIESAKDDKFIVNSKLFTDDFLIYTSDSDIVSLTMPLNLIHFNDKTDNSNSDEFESKSSSTEDSNPDPILYFVKADINDKGQKEYKGLYSLKDGKATLVLETGTDAAASNDGTTKVYFSATDGIYVFDANTNNTEKYETFSESLIGLVKINNGDELYVLSEDHEVFKVSKGGNKVEILDDLKDTQQIVLDYSNNLYLYGKDKVPYVVYESGIRRKIIGTPENPTYAQLIKAPSSIKNGVVFAADDKVYIVYANATAVPIDVVLEVKPTAYAPEASTVHYYSYDKKIYAYSYLQFIFSKLPIEPKKILEEKLSEFQILLMASNAHLK